MKKLFRDMLLTEVSGSKDAVLGKVTVIVSFGPKILRVLKFITIYIF